MSKPLQTANTRLTTASGFAVAALTTLYAAVLIFGLMTLPTPGESILDPWFTLMELLILCIAPCMVAFTVGIKSLALPENRAVAILAIVFMSICVAITSVVHFAILTLSHFPAFQDASWHSLVFGFQWPSLAYALDILAWDVFFPLSAACTALSLRGVPDFTRERGLFMIASVLSFAGLVGVPLANMELRNIGIIGYVVFYPFAAAMVSFKLLKSRGQVL